ncbi:MAG: AraC family transcriptional regulator [Eubacteriales bacterium]|nr:AraC family transcriptional regulator [Bacillota bacterium]MBV1727257.1 AraC family transcriptional regulator [Desulforudis sp.]MDQ7788477.1 AraC family transcriptional regulator [Clostridia bacterium]MDZ4043159.1 AraC family transcriptional regulator [Eubacteriales bacterium]MBU4553794.1 AraC family transcriptional regulator [Bacillota bacterium]
MGNLKSRVAYLQGLAAGLEMAAESKEGKLLSGIVDVLVEFANSVEELGDSQDSLEDYLESIDEDLYTLESRLNEVEDEDDCEHILEVECPECGCTEAMEIEDDDIPTAELIRDHHGVTHDVAGQGEHF